MRLPGFAAESSVYRTSGHYQISSASEQAGGVILQELSFSPVLRHCGTCYLDPMLGCVRDCYACPPGRPPDGCSDWTERCDPSQCPSPPPPPPDPCAHIRPPRAKCDCECTNSTGRFAPPNNACSRPDDPYCDDNCSCLCFGKPCPSPGCNCWLM